MKTILLILAALPVFGQTAVNYIATTGNVSLSSTTTAATLQQPATDATPVYFPGGVPGVPVTSSLPPVGATVYCSAACVATISRNCTTAASATAGTVTGVVRSAPAASVTFWTASNASGCTTLRVLNINAGQEYPIDMSQFSLSTSGTTSNIHISIASVTATVNITFYPVEAK